MLTHSRCVLNLTKPCPIVSYHLCGAPSFVWYLLQFFIYHDYYFCDPKRIVASWSRGFQVICFIPRPELLINLPRSLIDMETVTQNLLQPSHSGKRLIMSKARWGEISLAILAQNKAKYSIMLARRALSKMKKMIVQTESKRSSNRCWNLWKRPSNQRIARVFTGSKHLVSCCLDT